MEKPQLVTTLRLHTALFMFFEQDYVEIWFDDGTMTKTYIEPSEEQEARAKSLGYTSIAQMNRWHDFLHLFLAYHLGFFERSTPWIMAHEPDKMRLKYMKDFNQKEEALNFAFAAWINVGRDDEWLDSVRHYDLDELAQIARDYMQGVEDAFK